MSSHLQTSMPTHFPFKHAPRRHRKQSSCDGKVYPTHWECPHPVLNAYYAPVAGDSQGPNSTKGPVGGGQGWEKWFGLIGLLTEV